MCPIRTYILSPPTSTNTHTDTHTHTRCVKQSLSERPPYLLTTGGGIPLDPYLVWLNDGWKAGFVLWVHSASAPNVSVLARWPKPVLRCEFATKKSVLSVLLWHCLQRGSIFFDVLQKITGFWLWQHGYTRFTLLPLSCVTMNSTFCNWTLDIFFVWISCIREAMSAKV